MTAHNKFIRLFPPKLTTAGLLATKRTLVAQNFTLIADFDVTGKAENVTDTQGFGLFFQEHLDFAVGEYYGIANANRTQFGVVMDVGRHVIQGVGVSEGEIVELQSEDVSAECPLKLHNLRFSVLVKIANDTLSVAYKEQAKSDVTECFKTKITPKPELSFAIAGSNNADSFQVIDLYGIKTIIPDAFARTVLDSVLQKQNLTITELNRVRGSMSGLPKIALNETTNAVVARIDQLTRSVQDETTKLFRTLASVLTKQRAAFTARAADFTANFTVQFAQFTESFLRTLDPATGTFQKQANYEREISQLIEEAQWFAKSVDTDINSAIERNFGTVLRVAKESPRTTEEQILLVQVSLTVLLSGLVLWYSFRVRIVVEKNAAMKYLNR